MLLSGCVCEYQNLWINQSSHPCSDTRSGGEKKNVSELQNKSM